MTIYYLIEDISGEGFWDIANREFGGYSYTWKFESYEGALNFAQKEVKGIFKITKIYDAK